MVSLYLFVYLSIYFFSWLVSQFAICSSDYVYNHMYIYIYRCVYMYKKKYKHTCMHIYIYTRPYHTLPYGCVMFHYITIQYNITHRYTVSASDQRFGLHANHQVLSFGLSKISVRQLESCFLSRRAASCPHHIKTHRRDSGSTL